MDESPNPEAGTEVFILPNADPKTVARAVLQHHIVSKKELHTDAGPLHVKIRIPPPDALGRWQVGFSGWWQDPGDVRPVHDPE